MVLAVACSYCSIAPGRAGDNERDRVRKKETMVFRRCAKFVAELDPGHCSLGAEGLNAHRVEVTP